MLIILGRPLRPKLRFRIRGTLIPSLHPQCGPLDLLSHFRLFHLYALKLLYFSIMTHFDLSREGLFPRQGQSHRLIARRCIHLYCFTLVSSKYLIVALRRHRGLPCHCGRDPSNLVSLHLPTISRQVLPRPSYVAFAPTGCLHLLSLAHPLLRMATLPYCTKHLPDFRTWREYVLRTDAASASRQIYSQQYCCPGFFCSR